MANLQKITRVKKIADSIEKNKNFILLKYNTVNTRTFNELRSKLEKTEAKLTIVKNTLFEKTINLLGRKNKNMSNLRAKFFPLKESTALICFGNDWHSGLHVFYDFVKGLKNISFKLGILDDEIYDRNQLIQISLLPGRNELIAKIIGSCKNPAQKIVLSMKFGLSKLIYTLNQKSGGGDRHV